MRAVAERWRHAVFAEGDCGQRDSERLFRHPSVCGRTEFPALPSVGQPHVEFHEVEVEGLETVELAVELGLGGSGDHHRVVDTLAIDGFAGGEETGPGSESRVVGFAMREGTVGVVRNGANFGDAVDEPETTDAVAVVDGVVGVGVGVVLQETRKNGGVAGFDDAGYAGGRSGAVRCDAGDAVVGDEDVDVLSVRRDRSPSRSARRG